MEQEAKSLGRGRAKGRNRFVPQGAPAGSDIDSDASVMSFSTALEIDSISLRDNDAGSQSSSSTYAPSSTVTGTTDNMSSDESVSTTRQSTETGSSGGRTSTSNYSQESSIVKTINDGFNKVGEDGHKVQVVTNYYQMNETPDFHLYQFRVDFTPVEDNTSIKKALLRQHEDTLNKYVFDGSVMYRTRLIPKEFQTLHATSVAGNVAYTITIRLVGQVNPEDSMYLQFYNIVMRKTMTLINMEELGRNMYDRAAAIKFPQDRLELWPGFITAIRNHERGTLLCVEVTHKVLRTCTVLDLMRAIKQPGMSANDFEKAVRAEIEDTIVMTHYNRRTYTISDVDFKATPASSFRGQDGSIQTYAEYYQCRYNITITEEMMKQPLLVSKPKKKDINKGVTGDIYLLPSLCNPTGLSNDMRKNFSLMKRLSEHLHMDPTTRKKKLDEFMYRLTTNEKVQEEFAAWNIKFAATALNTEARIMKKQQIVLGPDPDSPILPDDKGDWTRPMKNSRSEMLKPEHVKRWVVMSPPKDVPATRSFLTTLKKMGQEIGIQVSQPLDIIEYDVNRYDQTILDEKIRNFGQLDLVFFVLPNNTLRRYAEIKNYTTLVLGVPSQCFLSKNLTNKNLNSIASKVIIQMTAKLGGVPWSVKVPLKKLMVLGLDVYHCSNRKGESAGALVATSSPSLTSYLSLVSFHKDKSELATNLFTDFTIMLQESMRINQYLPSKIVMYRDGVGEGQIGYVLSHEIAQMKLAITDVYGAAGEEMPKLTFVIVTKKINTRAFLNGKQNLPVGTVIDTGVTLPERYDFFLVSQDVRQGTVSPTNYNVVLDEMAMPADRLQLLSYKMCHLYFNWSGTVAVPAPCQYAHKLAYITGVAIGERALPSLTEKLWYL
ncbi:piwi-like protein Siwi [Folsomia candida]|uniref:piwi-like protein Siwi n=1 Tax=Folsomia candida TaxID=158441 RepID=UPI000B8F7184|nr:piwi-like protein Siwi [Folsomia candida]XP_035703475.1 piwi-like protein Siwi [Folsomia candida]